MQLTKEEIIALYEYFMKAGYISYEFHPIVLSLIPKFRKFVETPEG
jgi:hypothetical protein